MKKAIGYIRVSTQEQATQGQSLEAQEKAIKNYCDYSELELVDIICDKGVSGTKYILDRPGGKKLTEYTNSGIDNIISVKLDRMFRKTVDALNQIQSWTEQNINVHLLDLAGSTVSTASTTGKFMLTIIAAFAELEANKISERTKEGLDNKRQKGEVIGSIPFGYKREGDILIELPNRAKAIAAIKDMANSNLGSRFIAKAVKDDYDIDCSHVTICKLINELKLNEQA
jgi:DNA invertase Pin-like site-specific DNA recombinase